MATLPPMGCLPAAITIFGSGSHQCVERFNNDAISFNRRLNSTTQSLQNRLSNLTVIVLDTYTPLRNLVKKPSDSGAFKYLKLNFHYKKKRADFPYVENQFFFGPMVRISSKLKSMKKS